ncbi:hypothetical protein PoB_002104700 [Plakobranchus ocellatus]|uniref:Uncharacterized protein n=1 Tax=Plakobranchus ocellatus TaxID=259542 RepID=A0AAV3ZJ27_9GAST|nr:hypothetical protein PoB_002104700 [Plakobranchus ocellatus]
MFWNEAVFLRSGVSMQFVNREALVILCVNYAFFSVVVLSFILVIMLMTNTSQTHQDLMTSLSMMALSFIFIDLVIANFLVESIRLQTEIKAVYQM